MTKYLQKFNFINYEIYRGHSSNGIKTKIGTTAGTRFIDSNVRCINCCDNTATYYYWVKAANPAGDSDYSSYDTGYARRTLPDSNSVSASDGTVPNCVEVTWNPIPGAKSYIVYRAPNRYSEKTAFFTLTNSTTYTDTTVSCFATYYYWVRAVDSKGYFCTSTFTGNYDTGYSETCAE